MLSYNKSIRDIMIAIYLKNDGLSQHAIAKILGCNQTAVHRMLKDANQYIETRYNFPGIEKYEAYLIRKYKLKDAIVVETGHEGQALNVVAQAAARFFLERIESGDRIAVSCGRTLLEMVHSLPISRRLKLTLTQLSIETYPDAIHQAPSTIVGIMKSKYPASEAVGIQLPPLIGADCELEYRKSLTASDYIEDMRRDVLNSNYLFVGIGQVTGESYFILMANQYTNGKFSRYVASLGIAGEINNQVYDYDGLDRSKEIPELYKGFINIASIDDIRRKAGEPHKATVVGVATGINKIAAVETALRTKLINVLITSRELAEAMQSI